MISCDNQIKFSLTHAVYSIQNTQRQKLTFHFIIIISNTGWQLWTSFVLPRCPTPELSWLQLPDLWISTKPDAQFHSFRHHRVHRTSNHQNWLQNVQPSTAISKPQPQYRSGKRSSKPTCAYLEQKFKTLLNNNNRFGYCRIPHHPSSRSKCLVKTDEKLYQKMVIKVTVWQCQIMHQGSQSHYITQKLQQLGQSPSPHWGVHNAPMSPLVGLNGMRLPWSCPPPFWVWNPDNIMVRHNWNNAQQKQCFFCKWGWQSVVNAMSQIFSRS